MKKPIVVVGMGEMGDLFARGFLKLGHPVVPLLRGMDPGATAEAVPDPELVLIAVGEDDLHPVLDRVPAVWRKRLTLLQNELLPQDWLRHGIADPTVVVVWFDKKKGRPFVAVLPTPVAGPGADLVVRALDAIEVPGFSIADAELLYELVRKNLYILVVNIVGIRVGGTVSELWARHRDLAEAVAAEVLAIQEWLAGRPLPRERLKAGLVEGFEGDPQHICRGRSAPRRLQRALALAADAGIAVPVLRGIAEEWSKADEPVRSA
jgi:ketopantoate reductase